LGSGDEPPTGTEVVPMTDYRSLLKKYIRRVGDEEGYSFVDPDWMGEYITSEERAELTALQAEMVSELTPEEREG
jgi:hypothetical protein